MLGIVAVDFDGTVVDHRYPEVGPTLPMAVESLKQMVGLGVKIILWTMRSGKELDDAVNWYKENDIPLFGINENPEQASWTTSPKAYAQLYIDDAAFGAPLMQLAHMARPGIDWSRVCIQPPTGSP